MHLPIFVQLIACFSGLAGIYFADDAQLKSILAVFVVLGSGAAVAVAWKQKQGADFAERALSSLVRSVELNDLARGRVVSALLRAGTLVGFPNAIFQGYAGGYNLLRFYRDSSRQANDDIDRVLLVRNSQLASLAVESDVVLQRRAHKMFRRRSAKTRRTRDELAEEIGDLGKVSLWKMNIQTPEWAVWVNDEQIAVPVAPPNGSAIPEQRVRFPREEFEHLMTMSEIDLHTLVYSQVAEKLESAQRSR